MEEIRVHHLLDQLRLGNQDGKWADHQGEG
jgi:hypothetical protein